MSGITSVAQQSIWSSFFDAAKDVLVDTSGLLSIAHQSVIQAIKERYLQDAATETHYHRLLANFFQEKSLSLRKVGEYPSHLMFINDAERMKQFLLDINVFKMVYNDFTKYQLLRYWQMTKGIKFNFKIVLSNVKIYYSIVGSTGIVLEISAIDTINAANRVCIIGLQDCKLFQGFRKSIEGIILRIMNNNE